jgi:hypothetical protein
MNLDVITYEMLMTYLVRVLLEGCSCRSSRQKFRLIPSLNTHRLPTTLQLSTGSHILMLYTNGANYDHCFRFHQ